MLLLKDPLLAFNYYLPKVSRPSHATDLQWNNHLFGLASLVCDLIATVNEQPLYITLKTLKTHLLSANLIKNFDKKTLKEVSAISRRALHPDDIPVLESETQDIIQLSD